MVINISSTAYLLTKNGSLFGLDLHKNTEENLALTTDCLRSQTVTAMAADFAWNRANSPLIYALTWNGLLYFDVSSKKCTDVEIDWTKFGGKIKCI